MAPTGFAAFVLMLALGTSAFQIPEDASDGVYIAYHNTNGTEVHTQQSDIADVLLHYSQRRSVPATDMTKRWGDDQCICNGQGEIVNSQDLQVAQVTLGASCDAGGDSFLQKTNGVHYVKKNDVVVFVCNFASNPQYCSSRELHDGVSSVQKQCQNAEGWYLHTNWAKSYGYVKADGRFCH